jgi:hypothetical protein
VLVKVHRHSADKIPELRMQMNLVASVPALYESVATHYEAWERAISGFAVGRIGQPADSLFAFTSTRA